MSTVCRVLFEEEQHAFREAIGDATDRFVIRDPIEESQLIRPITAKLSNSIESSSHATQAIWHLKVFHVYFL